jgi:hypothetical protein
MSNELRLETQASLLKGIISDVQLLFRKEMELASAEVKRDMRTLGAVGAQVGAAALLGLLGLGLLALTLVHLMVWLFPDLPLWGAYAITAAGFVLGAGIAAKGGLEQWNHARLGPTHTIETMKENGQWLKAQL